MNYLCRSLDSIINQPFYDIAIILIDDGSTEGSGQMCVDYCEKDNRIRVTHNENNCYRSFCLRRMYRVMALLRYWSRGYACHEFQ